MFSPSEITEKSLTIPAPPGWSLKHLTASIEINCLRSKRLHRAGIESRSPMHRVSALTGCLKYFKETLRTFSSQDVRCCCGISRPSAMLFVSAAQLRQSGVAAGIRAAPGGDPRWIEVKSIESKLERCVVTCKTRIRQLNLVTEWIPSTYLCCDELGDQSINLEVKCQSRRLRLKSSVC